MLRYIAVVSTQDGSEPAKDTMRSFKLLIKDEALARKITANNFKIHGGELEFTATPDDLAGEFAKLLRTETGFEVLEVKSRLATFVARNKLGSKKAGK